MDVEAIVRTLATLAWIAAIVIVVIAIVRAARGQAFRGASSIVIGIVLFAILATLVAAGLVFMQPEERGVVISAIAPKGYREEALEPGLHWIIPFFEGVVPYSIAKQTYTMSIATTEGQLQGDDSISARTSDGQVVLIDASVIYAINPDEVINLHIAWKDRYERDLIRPQSRGIIRDEASQYRIDDIVSKERGALSAGISAILAETLAANGLIMDDFVLRNIQFSDEYADSVEQKQIAEQQALQAAFVVQQREQEAEQLRKTAQGRADADVIEAEGRAQARVIEANAEAEAVRLIADALGVNPDYLTFEYIRKLSPGIQVMLVPNDNPYLLPLPSLESKQTVPAPAPTTD